MARQFWHNRRVTDDGAPRKPEPPSLKKICIEKSSRASRRPAADPGLDRALEAMSAPELRSFVRTVFDGLDDDQRTALTESLVATRDARPRRVDAEPPVGASG